MTLLQIQIEPTDTLSSVELLRPEHIVEAWKDELRPLVERGLAEGSGKFSIRYIFDCLMTGEMQLWQAPQSALVTRIINYDAERVLELFVGAGEGIERYLGEGLDLIADYAREQGCDSMELWGRKGWIRMLADHGFENRLYVVRKAL